MRTDNRSKVIESASKEANTLNGIQGNQHKKVKNTQTKAIILAVLAAVLYALSSPFSKLLLEEVPEKMMAAFLYLGAGIGLSFIGLLEKRGHISNRNEQKLDGKDTPYVIGMIVLDIVAPILLMMGLNRTAAANVSLLNNFEIVATTLIAGLIFREKISKRLLVAIALVTVASGILSFEDVSSLHFSLGSFFVLGATICWGFENNCTRKLSDKDPLQIVVVKGFGSGAGALVIAFMFGERFGNPFYILLTLILGFVAYGLSIFFYVYAQRTLGAAKTSAYYAIAPFVGVFLSLLIFGKIPQVTFYIALLFMAAGTYLVSKDGEKEEN